MDIGIILVHGYLSSGKSMKSLYTSLMSEYGDNSVANIQLPGHNTKDIIPEFDIELFTETIYSQIVKFKNENKKIVLIGHSTGGVFILSTLLRYNFEPLLVILASTPFKIDFNYYERWKKHSKNIPNVSFTDICKMISTINMTCCNYKSDCAILAINGDNDELVLSNELLNWKLNNHRGNIRTATIPNGTHSIFSDSSKKLAIDVVKRALTDAVNSVLQTKEFEKKISKLEKVEPEAVDFLENYPFSVHNFINSPGYKQFNSEKITLKEYSKTEPTIANIEITNYCNLECKYCFRTQSNIKLQHMSLTTFKKILAQLPHSYKINLVGLGEPLLHPQILEIIQYARETKRRVAVVTNGTLLTGEMSKQIISSGLNSIAFSIDYCNQKSADELRKGTDLNQVKINIKKFINLNNQNRVSTVVFAAVSKDTLIQLTSLMEFVLDLGIKVLMLTDLNFEYNKENSLSNNVNEEYTALINNAVKYAFSKRLIVLSVRGLEALSLESNYKDFLLFPSDQLYKRSEKHSYCYSPWQTVPINVNGDISICDCMPVDKIGNILEDPFSKIWNGKKMREHRRNMLNNSHLKTCLICPRF